MITKLQTGRNFLFNPVSTEIFNFKILGNPSIEALKASISNAVLNYQILNCRILGDIDGEYYFVPKESVNEPYIEVRDYELSAEEFTNEQSSIPFDLAKGEFQRFIIIPKSDYIVMNIVQHHIVGDGMSLLMLVQKIMQNLDTIDKNNGDLELEVPNMEKIQVLTNDDIMEHVRLNDLLQATVDKFNEEWKDEKMIFSYEEFKEFSEEYWNDNPIKVRRDLVSAEDMENIVQLCRAEGITVNSLLYTIASRAFGKKMKMGYVVNCRTDKFSSYGNFVNSLIVDCFYDEKLSFWDNARIIHNIMKCNAQDLSTPLLGTLIMNSLDGTLIDASNFLHKKGFEHKIVKEYVDTLSLGDQTIPFLSSNLGVIKIPTVYGKYQIDELYIGSPLDPLLDCNLGVITVNGKMTINAEYINKNGIDYNDILDQVIEGLHEVACGVEQNSSDERELQLV
ncbi:condensation domain-containing protein [[Clostridium] polysaccharolyticum]|uniref:Uncharacterized protein, contains a NRPS condensation (Elongation) domain n=1 Tax=[Clostridium] polysaccharolyticum TaxID=29364 RepID=A0A1I0FIE2_9FIRM|nr:condensation domain-containing protein [[Clostridium] polysaccharolyticum]SET58015.1 Uncharacterized protein, contains a NRPS condensation (elongation) domain [[Clostridium] polysaccharolyticum]